MSKAKNIKLIGFVSLGLVMGLGGIAIALPAVSQSQRWISESNAVQETNSGLEATLIGLEEVKTRHDDVVALNDELNVKFPTTASGTLLLQDISNAAAQSGMAASSIQTVNISTPILADAPAAPVAEEPAAGDETAPSNEAPEAEPSTPKLATMNVEITVVGSSAQISAFLKALGQVDRAIKIDSVKISSQKDSNDNPLNSMTITGTTLLYKAIEDPSLSVPNNTQNEETETNTESNN
jgi:Tfp pilus assembly protein PilO